MRAALIGLALTFMVPVASAHAATAEQLHRTSWAQPGVSFDQYRADSIACSFEAVTYDITRAAPGQRLVGFLKAQEDLRANAWLYGPAASSWPYGGLGASYSEHGPWIEHFYDAEYRDVADLQHGLLDRCLTSRGYQPFQLTDEQLRGLDRLKRGTEARHLYLYRLATDPRTVRRQSLTTL